MTESQATADEVRSAEREWQNQTGWEFQEQSHSHRGTREILERHFEKIASALDLAPGCATLDIGCGTGFLLDSLSRRSRGRCYGIDLSQSALRSARTRSPALGLAIGDAEKLPFGDATLDRVVCHGSAHHFLDVDAAMREIHRILVPGGRLVLFEPAATPFSNGLRAVVDRFQHFESPADLAIKHHFTRERVEEILAHCGFTRTRSELSDFLAYPLTGMYMSLPWSNWRGLFRFLWSFEGQLARLRFLRPAYDAVSWRLMVVADKPRA